MFTTHSNSTHSTPLSRKDVNLAEQSSKILSTYLKSTSLPMVQLINKKKQQKQLTLPISALKLLAEILAQMAVGNAVAVVSTYEELSTQEAANLLNVSRPYLVSLLKEGKIPYRKIGTKRRILTHDILEYKNHIDKARLKTLNELTKQAQKLNMGY